MSEFFLRTYLTNGQLCCIITLYGLFLKGKRRIYNVIEDNEIGVFSVLNNRTER